MGGILSLFHPSLGPSRDSLYPDFIDQHIPENIIVEKQKRVYNQNLGVIAGWKLVYEMVIIDPGGTV